MRKSQKIWMLLALILIVVLSSATMVKACGGGDHPGGPDNSGGCPGYTDPVLLNTGEFLFARTEAVIPGANLDF